MKDINRVSNFSECLQKKKNPRSQFYKGNVFRNDRAVFRNIRMMLKFYGFDFLHPHVQ